MILKIYSIYDIKAKIYFPPIFHHNSPVAMRSIATHMKSGGMGMMSNFPEDYQLYEIGAYDDQTGQIETLQNPTMICLLSDLRPETEAQ